MPKHRPRRRNARSVRRTAAALAGGALVVLPTLTTGLPAPVVVANAGDSQPDQAVAAPPQQPNIVMPPIAVDGSLPQPPLPEPLVVPGGRAGSAGISGSLGIPGSMLKAYKNAADILAKEQPDCHLDWALIASIGRIESNHARGGYVNAGGDTLEPILGPVLNGAGAFAAIRDTDGGKYDGDTVWDRAVGPTQFIPSTWRGYASDGNGDGVSNPNNIYDETLATARYLCSGGLDLSTDAGQRIAVRRYNNSSSYVDTVMAWAAAYRGGVAQLPDSQVPIGTPNAPDAAAAGSPVGVPAPPAPVVTPPPGTTLPGTSTTPTTPSSTTPASTTPTTPATPTTEPTTPSTPTPPPSTTSTTPPPSSTAANTPADSTDAPTETTSTSSAG
ncbi:MULTISPECIES: lytic murein transglycosylase [unclassified Amycolatopsis]|uniref:lytic transglycosylase domain-containing protein n=1 Tax=unclassified Amycolatopsis TaxID=2618356 RepID=UPI002874FCDE|nr:MULTISPECIES: lytic murein transglycosylase [unclassified Amycolatopsis]MDS0132002.1 lytic murein transglycosylase [Amycolatopsis sp. 505]MDS0141260.1 lytic murein transglycosylase [Amycolatopsis sp. CM201R]